MPVQNSPATYEASSQQIHEAVSAWFLGPQAENAELLKDLFNDIVADHVSARTSYHPEDGAFITQDIKHSEVYHRMVATLRTKLARLSSLLNDRSVPFYSPRYAAHMVFESSLPSIAGWLAAMLLNPNNVSFDAGPITTLLELEVGRDLCRMLGFEEGGDVRSWGHLTCDGTVANIEAIWTARNLKFYPLALRAAMAPSHPLHFLSKIFTVPLPSNPAIDVPLCFLSTWELLNLRPADILSIPDRLTREHNVSTHFLETTLSKYLVQSTGMAGLGAWGVDKSPKFLVASTKHYSWPKGVALAGVGSENLVNVPVDIHARIDVQALRHILDHHLSTRQAVYAVVAIMGSTEEGAVDPLAKIIELREEYQAKGLSFIVHADAAWGGYFTATLRDPPAEWHSTWPGSSSSTQDASERTPFNRDYSPTLAMKPYTLHQLGALKDADSVTVDPHKGGYCPYPAGGLCYRDRRMRCLLTWTAPYIQHGKRGESIGVHGVEGSKPGAAAAAVYMHHSVVGLHKRGHGGLLGEVSFTCARIAAHWATMSDASTPYTITPFNPLRSESTPASPAATAELEAEKRFIKERILGRSNEELIKEAESDPGVLAELRALGSDLNINAFVCNFRVRRRKGEGREGTHARTEVEDGKGDGEQWEWVLNDDVSEANYLNRCIFDRLSVTDIGQHPRKVPLFISATVLQAQDYGVCLERLKERAGLEAGSGRDLFVLRNVVMSPFQAGAGFVGKMEEAFRRVLEESLKHVVEKNTVTPQIHRFIVQGTDRLFLAYRPLFHKANGRQQLILEVDVPDRAQWAAYLEARTEHPNAIFELWTRPTPVTIEQLLQGEEPLPCLVLADSHVVLNVACAIVSLNLTIAHPRVVKHRSLRSRYLDAEYPGAHTPFYLYGTPAQAHIDHMLLKAPNAQFSAEGVGLELDHPVPSEKLAAGVILYVLNAPEAAMQPFQEDRDGAVQCFFYPDAQFEVMVCDDPFEATAHGPGLADASTHKHPVIARGKMRLPLNVFVDMVDLNREDFRGNERITPGMVKGMDWEDQTAWMAMVRERLDEGGNEYFTSNRNHGVDGMFNDGRDISRKPDLREEVDADADVKAAGYN
ncbi:hypothetical protein D9611_000881 [Ephemerocybe angulata]|uniref:PLP-dependent transferase n=1 Tax=Ephemerocybe angulata TaxID=980116 RepID=A0A8H5F7J5_9AGAR|nr:hypothetical protein D9611_000881 [Tulosesus angulatus]